MASFAFQCDWVSDASFVMRLPVNERCLQVVVSRRQWFIVSSAFSRRWINSSISHWFHVFVFSPFPCHVGIAQGFCAPAVLYGSIRDSRCAHKKTSCIPYSLSWWWGTLLSWTLSSLIVSLWLTQPPEARALFASFVWRVTVDLLYTCVGPVNMRPDLCIQYGRPNKTIKCSVGPPIIV